MLECPVSAQENKRMDWDHRSGKTELHMGRELTLPLTPFSECFRRFQARYGVNQAARTPSGDVVKIPLRPALEAFSLA